MTTPTFGHQGNVTKPLLILKLFWLYIYYVKSNSFTMIFDMPIAFCRNIPKVQRSYKFFPVHVWDLLYDLPWFCRGFIHCRKIICDFIYFCKTMFKYEQVTILSNKWIFQCNKYITYVSCHKSYISESLCSRMDCFKLSWRWSFLNKIKLIIWCLLHHTHAILTNLLFTSFLFKSFCLHFRGVYATPLNVYPLIFAKIVTGGLSGQITLQFLKMF